MQIRGSTSDNQLDSEFLESIGVTEKSWSPLVNDGTFVGFVAEDDNKIVAFCFGDTITGEVLVLAVLAGYEGRGLGKQLLCVLTTKLFEYGHKRLFLYTAAKPVVRSYGFYRALNWQPTGKLDQAGDEMLYFHKQR
jgi:ribosomal protein S18 acetylase RimI-like enzyme